MLIRDTKPTDLSILAPIYVEAYNPLEIGENWDTPSALKLLEHLYHIQPDMFFTLEEDNQIIGAISALIKPWWDGHHITDGELFIHPDYQRKGYGKQLVKHMFTKSKEKYNAVSWDTFTHVVHEHPLKWYQNMGFEVINEWQMITGNIDEVLEKI
jgi:GNAT superfamily N-acetyltransferase